MNIKKIIKEINYAFSLYLIIFVSLMAGVGFIFGSFNLALWFIENTGELPSFLIWTFKSFGIMMYIGVTFASVKIFLWIAQAVTRKRGKK